MKLRSLENGLDIEHNGFSFVEISIIFPMQDDVFDTSSVRYFQHHNSCLRLDVLS